MPILSVDNVVVGEASSVAQVVFRLNAPSAVETSFRFYTSGFGASDGNDFGDYGFTTIVFEPGETLKTVEIPIYNDTAVENTEPFILVLDQPNGLTIDNPYPMVTIIDNDRGERAPIASVGDVYVDETDGLAHFAITLDRSASVPVTVSYRTQNGTAGSGDFGAQSGSVTFAPGETAKTIDIAITDDATAEGIETFDLYLDGITGVSGASLSDNVGTAKIGASDQSTQASPQLTLSRATAMEGDGFMNAVFELNRPSNQATSFRFYTSGFNASDGNDFGDYGYTTIVFEPGETLKTVLVPIYQDATPEGTEAFSFVMDQPVGLTLAATTATATILDDDPAQLILSARTVELTEGSDGGTRNLAFTITREGDLSGNGSVNWAVQAASAGLNAGDFVGNLPSGTVTFAANQATRNILVPVLRDTNVEADEAFRVVLSNASAGLVITEGETLVSILNDDSAPAASYSIVAASADKNEGDSGTTPFTFTVTRSGDTSGAGSVGWAVSSSEAMADDFAGSGFPSGTVSFSAGQTSKTVTVNVSGDTDVENAESFNVTLSSPSNGTIGTASATGTIRNDDTSTGSVIRGDNGNNSLAGTSADETLIGGIGADTLTGGGGADIFLYETVADSTLPFSGRDKIMDFSHADGDKIDLSAIADLVLVDADFTGAGNEI